MNVSDDLLTQAAPTNDARAPEGVRDVVADDSDAAARTTGILPSQELEHLVKATKEIQADRERLRRELEVGRDQALQEIWNQAAQLATLISAKAIGRSLTQDDHSRLMDEALTEMRGAKG